MKAVMQTRPVAINENVDVEEEIRQRAYELFESRGGAEGHELQDWLQAEEEIRNKEKNATAA